MIEELKMERPEGFYPTKKQLDRTPPAGTRRVQATVDKLSKADLENECEKLGLSPEGTIVQLRLRLQQHYEAEEFSKSTTPSRGAAVDGEETDAGAERSSGAGSTRPQSGSNDGEEKDSAPAEKEETASRVSSAQGDMMTMFLAMMQQQREERQAEERRREQERREEQERRREEERRRDEERQREEERRAEERQRDEDRRAEEQRRDEERRAEERLQDLQRMEIMMRNLEESRRSQMEEQRQINEKNQGVVLEALKNASPNASNAGSVVPDIQKVKRAVARLHNQTKESIVVLGTQLVEKKSKKAVQETLKGMERLKNKDRSTRRTRAWCWKH